MCIIRVLIEASGKRGQSSPQDHKQGKEQKTKSISREIPHLWKNPRPSLQRRNYGGDTNILSPEMEAASPPRQEKHVNKKTIHLLASQVLANRDYVQSAVNVRWRRSILIEALHLTRNPGWSRDCAAAGTSRRGLLIHIFMALRFPSVIWRYKFSTSSTCTPGMGPCLRGPSDCSSVSQLHSSKHC